MFKNMKIGTMLLTGFLVISLIGSIVAGIGIVNMSKINDKADDLYFKELMGLSYIKEANINLIYAGRARGNYLLSTTTEERQKYTEHMKKYLAVNMDYMEKAKPLFMSKEAHQIFAKYASVEKEYEKLLWNSMSMAAAEKLLERSEGLTQMLVQVRGQADILDDLLTDLAKLKEARAKQASDDTTAMYESSRMLMIMLVLGSSIAGIVLGMLITRFLTRQLGGEPVYAVGVAEHISAGDLTVDIAVKPGDQSSLLFAMKTMRDSLVNIVTQVRSGTDTIATASSQISSGNLDLSSRTEEQASSLEETASSMEELTSTVKQNADNARQANTLAMSASEVAIRGGDVVSQVVSTMDSITESSRKIADIIGVIDGIAFQTNILALNAAVEAARAGDQGRGFAVVASEVRTLAQRSAAAAKEIKLLIDDSVEKVNGGSRQVAEAGVTMDEIVTSVKRVTDIMGEIASASNEQSAGIEQINMAINQMDEVTQQNAALVEEAAAASQSMQDQAASLSRVVGVFKLNGVQNAMQNATAARHATAIRPTPSAQGSRKPLAVKAPLNRAPAGKLALASGDEGWEEF